MTRAVPEWIGRSSNTHIPARVRIRVINAQQDRCGCGCGVKLGMAGEAIDIDHMIALINGGENRESNLQALRRPCHQMKTGKDVAEKSLTARRRAKALGVVKKSRNPIPGSKGSGMRKKMDGTVVFE